MPQNHYQQEEEDNEKEEDGNKAEGEEDEYYTPWSNTEKDEIFHDADEIKTFGDEAPIPTGRLRDLLKHINITTLGRGGLYHYAWCPYYMVLTCLESSRP
jgi:hypothetical protein